MTFLNKNHTNKTLIYYSKLYFPIQDNLHLDTGIYIHNNKIKHLMIFVLYKLG